MTTLDFTWVATPSLLHVVCSLSGATGSRIERGLLDISFACAQGDLGVLYIYIGSQSHGICQALYSTTP